MQRLENEFVTGYQDGDRVLYVALHNHKDEDLKVTEAISSTWDPFWKAASDDFDARVLADPDLAHSVGKMFFVWESNHRLTACWRHVNRFHASEESWHISPWYIVLDSRKQSSVLMNVMNDINWYVFFQLNFFLMFSALFLLSSQRSYYFVPV